MHIKHIGLGALALLLFVAPLTVLAGAEHEQEFLVTAYYSPIPNQCCYVRGSLEGDTLLNGEGRVAADGTAVYFGMAAAPGSYPFGTVIELPGIGVFRVHDRGEAIRDLGDGLHRLDLWVGGGEEGLARALSFGEVRIRGKVHPVGSTQPLVSFDPSLLDAPWKSVRPYLVEGITLLRLRPKVGDQNYSVALLQQTLRDLGYFNHAVTGLFGPVTRNALRHFLRDMGLREPPHRLTEESAAYMLSALKLRGREPELAIVRPGSSGDAIEGAQKTLRFLGYYDGRTDGVYSDTLREAIFSFQRSHGIVQSERDRGAGHIGPRTLEAVEEEWRRMHIKERAEEYLTFLRIEERLTKEQRTLTQFLGEGERGSDVRHLQAFLASEGFFPEGKVNGVFGPLTKEAVLKFQLSRGILEDPDHPAAGYVGPRTLRALRREVTEEAYGMVRSEGWESLKRIGG